MVHLIKFEIDLGFETSYILIAPIKTHSQVKLDLKYLLMVI